MTGATPELGAKSSYAAALEGTVSGAGRRFALLVARFNAGITEQLSARARTCLLEHGAAPDAVAVFHVPGAWELPQAAARLAGTGAYDALIAIGCVIRGDTPHFDYIAGEAARGLGAVGRESGVPVVFGVLTTNTEEQALERADPARGDKGWEAALAALAMADLFARVPARRP